MSLHSLRPFLEPRSVAIIGASQDHNKIGGRPLHYLQRYGYKGPIFPINPGRKEVQGIVAYPDLAGILPGIGPQDPNEWGLGFEIRGYKTPHWTGRTNSPATFGHFGASGSFLWVDPAIGRSLLVLTDRNFGPWALDAWPPLADAVVAASLG